MAADAQRRRRIVFLDRDGTINVDSHYVISPEQVHLVADAGTAIGSLKKRSFFVVVVSNQSAVGRGWAGAEDVERTNLRLQELLLEQDEDARIDHFFTCPHAPEEDCPCRKPKTGMLADMDPALRAAASSGWVVGDKLSDLEFGENLGISYGRRILVLTGKGAMEVEQLESGGGVRPRCCSGLMEAAQLIIEESGAAGSAPDEQAKD